MPSERRRDAATATTGAVLVGSGAQLRHSGVSRAVAATTGKYPLVHPTVFRRTHIGRKAFLVGSAAEVVGGTALGVGLHRLARRHPDVPATPAGSELAKSDSRLRDFANNSGNFAAEGIAGTANAVTQRVDSYRKPQGSVKARLAAFGASTAAGTVGGRLAAGALRSHPIGHKLSPALSAVAGVTTAVGSLPLTNAVARRHGYEVTPTGVKRGKTAPVRPTRSATVIETRASRAATPGSRGQIVPSDHRMSKRQESIHFAHGTHGHPACGSSPRPTTRIVSSTRNIGRVTCHSCAKTKHYREAMQAVTKGMPHNALREVRNALPPNRVRYSQRSEGGERVTDAHVNGRNVGYAVVRDESVFDNIYVDPAHRGRGIGTGLGRRALKANKGSQLTASAKPYEKDGGTPPLTKEQLASRYAKHGVVVKYYGENMSGPNKRARVIAAGATPIIGPYAAAAQAARTAPPEQKASAAALQYGGYAAGFPAAYGGARLAIHAAKKPANAARMQAATDKIKAKRTGLAQHFPAPLARAIAPSGPGRVSRGVARIAQRPGAVGRLAKPLVAHPGPAAFGGVAGKTIGSAAGAWAGYSAVLHREKARNAKINSVAKALANDTELSNRQQRSQLRRKKRALGVSMVATGIGTAGAGVLAARELGPHLPRVGAAIERHKAGLERAGLSTALTGGAVGAYQGIAGVKTNRRDLKAEEGRIGIKSASLSGAPRAAGFRRSSIATIRRGNQLIPVRRANTVAKLYTEHKLHPDGRIEYRTDDGDSGYATDLVRAKDTASQLHLMEDKRGLIQSKRVKRFSLSGKGGYVQKIDTTMKEHEAKRIVAQHGLKGPLPKTLDRPARMKAYEARYVAAGGPKGEKWHHTADNLDHVTGGALGIGGVAALSQLHHDVRAKKLIPVHGKTAPIVHTAERRAGRSGRVALAAGGIGAISELAHRHAQHRAASYSSSPAGVASSALTRMRSYTPDD